MNFQKAILVFLFFHLSGTGVRAQHSWVFQKEKDGIRLSNRKANGSSFDDVRVETNLPGTVKQLTGILLDINHYKEWAYATKKSVLVKQISPTSLIYYSEVEVPWPATNRYYYANFILKEDLTNRSAQVSSASIPDAGPAPPDLVRVPRCKGTWMITTRSPQSIHIDYILEIDPGGSLPAWILNLFSSKGPMETFENIRAKMIALNPGISF